ncbi:MAG: M14 family zinc carboxypeptidase [Bacteroidota bacterium]
MRFAFLALLAPLTIGALPLTTHAQSLADVASQASDRAEAFTLGTTAGGRALDAIAIGAGDRDEMPALLVLGGVEHDDRASADAARAFARFLVESEADSVRALLDRATVYVVPALALDAHARADGLPGNDAPDDADRDGLTDEDGPDDLDGDGVLRWMRVEHPAGIFADPDDEDAEPLLLREVDDATGDVGRWLLRPEGRDNDGDGMGDPHHINEDGAGGTWLARNTTYNHEPYTDKHGRHPMEAPALRALADFVFAHPNIVAVYTFSRVDNIHYFAEIKGPPRIGRRFAPDSLAHEATTDALGDLARYTGTGDEPPGHLPSWVYYHLGRFSFTAPAWVFPPADSTDTTNTPSRHDLDRRALAYLRANDPDAVLDWTEVEHPDLPNRTVEIGGLAPFALTTPPADSVAAVNAGATTLLFALAERLPQLDVTARAEPLGRGVHRITLTLRNTGDLPTHAVAGRLVQAQQPLLIETDLDDGQTLAAGRPKQQLTDPIPGGGSAEAEMLIVGRGTVTFTVGSPSAGTQTVTLDLD